MGSSEKFSLRWNDFQENISSAFSSLRDDTDFTDVTLISEDGLQLQAHKVILSASSPFFMNIFKINRNPNPLLYLKGFKANQLHSIIDFMYHGVAEIQQENLDDFLAVAEELQLKGLTGRAEEKEECTEETMTNSAQEVMRHKIKEVSKLISEQEFYEKEYTPNPSTTVMTTNSPVSQVSFNGGTADDLKAVVWSMISQNGSVLTCTVCGKTKDKAIDTQAKHHMASHVESLHVDGVSYACNRCDNTFRSKPALHKHTHKEHKRIVGEH